jgi:hypothetical protein
MSTQDKAAPSIQDLAAGAHFPQVTAWDAASAQQAALSELTADAEKLGLYEASTQQAECTCPSGNGSLRWPCPVHAAQQAEPQDGPIAEGWSLSLTDGHSGYGVYAHMDEYPEEGAVLVMSVPKQAEPAQAALNEAQIELAWRLGYRRCRDTDIINEDFDWGYAAANVARAVESLGEPAQAAVPHPGSPEASAMMDSVLAEYNWPTNTKNAARAGYVAAARLMGVKLDKEQAR